jgi:hypothetical protein
VKIKNVASWKEDHTWDIYAQPGTEISLSLVNSQDEKFELIPMFFIPNTNFGKDIWDRFLKDLTNFLKLPIEEESP